MSVDFRPATPRVAAGVLFRDADSRVLLVKPTYKEGWDLPGGYVEPGESPKDAARREVREELGVEAAVGDLLVVDWAPHPDEGDKLLFVFAGTLTEPVGDLAPAASEIVTIEMVAPADLASRLPPRLLTRIEQALAPSHPTYLEHGEPPA